MQKAGVQTSVFIEQLPQYVSKWFEIATLPAVIFLRGNKHDVRLTVCYLIIM